MRYQLSALIMISISATFGFGQLGVGTGTGINTGNQGVGGGGGAGTVAGNFENLLEGRGESQVGGTGFLGRTNNTEGFLQANGGGNTAGGNRANFGNAGGFAAGGGRAGAGRQPQQQQSTRVVRTRIMIPRDFGRVIVPPARVQSRLNGQFRRVSNLRRNRAGASSVGSRVNTNGLRGSSVTATPSGRSVILSGSVLSERDRLIAEKMAKMEPGVESVVNQITVTN